MKNLTPILALSLFLLAACSTMQTATHIDDIYFSPDRYLAQAERLEVPAAVPDNRGTISEQYYNQDVGPAEDAGYYPPPSDYTEYYYDEDGDTYITHNYFFDGVHDYSFTSRIRRFHRYHHLGFGFYDPFFTNMFWYTHNPFHFGVSLYLGYGASPFYYPWLFDPWRFHTWGWHPHMNWWGWPSWGCSFGWGMGFGGWGWYNRGFWSGVRHGLWMSPFLHYQFVYNSLDRTNYFYGQRRSTGSTVAEGTRGVSGRHANNQSFAQRFENSPNRGSTIRHGRNGEAIEIGATRRGTETDAVRSRDENIAGRGARSIQHHQGGVPSVGGATDRTISGRGGASIEERETSPQNLGTQRSARQSEGVGPDQRGHIQDRGTHQRPDRTSTPIAAPAREPHSRDGDTHQRQPQQTASPARSETTPAQTRPRTYTPPGHQQPRSNQEYRSPGTNQRVTPAATQSRPPARVSPQPAPTQRDVPARTAPSQRPAAPAQSRPQPSQNHQRVSPQQEPTRSSSPQSISRSPSHSSPASSSPAPSRSGGGSSESSRSHSSPRR